jgi:superfamily II DNA or RNA helicase
MITTKSLSKTILTKSKNWASFKRSVDYLDNRQKGDAFEDLAQHFFQIDPKYRTKLKNVWNVNKREVPSRIHRKLNLQSLDLGIDLLAETTEGEFWAIQCKYHSDQRRSLKLDEVEGCMSLAFGHCNGISLAIICTSAEKYSRHLKKYAEEKLAYCDGSVWRSLDENFFKAVRKNLKGQSQPIKALKPRPHQKRAIKNALGHFVIKKNERGKMIMPCGSGKSLTGYWIADKFKAKKILVAVPSLALIKQTLEVWAEQSVANKKNVRWICVCSDKSVGNISNDDVAVQLQDLGIKIHTKPAEIASWLKKRSSATTVVFTTYQSGEAIATASKRAKYSFDLGICDEAHKTVGAKGKAFSHLLYEKNIKVKRRLFMTATERRYGGSTDKVISMDDHDLYGETFELLSFKEALECKPAILSDYKIITIGVTQQEVRENIRKNILVRPSKGAWNEETEIQMLTAALALRKAIKLKGIKHAVSFHSSIARAVAFRETQDKLTQSMRGLGKLETFHVSAKVQTADREKILDEFAESKRSLITNARCLTEGVDVKQIDCVVFADPKKSAVDIVQAVGRALRPFEGKKYGYVIVPQLIDSKTVKGRIEQNESFKDILMTLRALAANDERIVEYFRSVSEGKKVLKRDTSFEFVTPVGTKIDYEQFEDELKLRVWSRLAKLSWRPYEEAVNFVCNLGLNSQIEWRGCAKTKKIPEDIPRDPYGVYKNKGWVNWGEWLGTGTIAPQLKKYLKYNKAVSIVRKLGIENKAEWRKYILDGKLTENIPRNPDGVYKNKGWIDWGEWLGTGRVANQNRTYREFIKARSYIQSLSLRSQREWNNFVKTGKLPDDIPANPRQTYKNKGWKSWGDWLGTGRVADQYKTYRIFKYARAFARSLSLKSGKEWADYSKNEKLPEDIPISPPQTYHGKGWKGWGDWLGTGNIAPKLRDFKPFEKGREFARNLKLNSKKEWSYLVKAGKLPKNIPTAPSITYNNKGWKSWGDWLGTGKVANQYKIYRPLEDAKKFIKSLNLNSRKEWLNFTKSGKSPNDIPANPRQTYKNKGWKSWGDWLGTGTIATHQRTYRTYKEARGYAHKLNLKSIEEWREFSKSGNLPEDIPANPYQTYKNKGWIGVGDWLGTGKIANQLRLPRAFKSARKFARDLGLQSKTEWTAYAKSGKLPADIFTTPSRTYKDAGWKGWGDWLGTGAVAPQLRKYITYQDAAYIVSKLGLRSQLEWKEFTKSKKFPVDIPARPSHVYKNKGWKGWDHFLGKTK